MLTIDYKLKQHFFYSLCNLDTKKTCKVILGNVPCKFPFGLEDVFYKTCTRIRNNEADDTKAWCAIKTDDERRAITETTIATLGSVCP